MQLQPQCGAQSYNDCGNDRGRSPAPYHVDPPPSGRLIYCPHCSVHLCCLLSEGCSLLCETQQRSFPGLKQAKVWKMKICYFRVIHTFKSQPLGLSSLVLKKLHTLQSKAY